MILKNKYSIYLLSVAVAFLLGCVNEASNPEKNETNFSTTLGSHPTDLLYDRVVADEYVVDPVASTLTYYKIDETCSDDAEYVLDTTEIERQFLIQDSKLYLWNKGRCYARAFSGNSQELQGSSWEYIERTPVPGEGDDPECDYEDKMEELVHLEFTDSEVNGTYIVREYCPAAYSVGSRTHFAENDFEEEEYENYYIDCKAYRDIKGNDTILVEYTKVDVQEGVYETTYTYNNKSCVKWKKDVIWVPTEESCKENYPGDDKISEYADYTEYIHFNLERQTNFEEFENCIQEKGFPER